MDRTVRCSPLQPDFGLATLTVVSAPNPADLSEASTSVRLACEDEDFAFNFPVPHDIVSFFFVENINATLLTCNVDRLGGKGTNHEGESGMNDVRSTGPVGFTVYVQKGKQNQ